MNKQGGLIINCGGNGDWHCTVSLISFELVCGGHIVKHKKSFETEEETLNWIKEMEKLYRVEKSEYYEGDEQ